MSEIKDFIYLDTNKVSSLYSQISGGLVQSIESTQSNSEDSKNLRNYSFKVFKHEAGGTETESNQLKETRVSHHEVYNELETELFKHGYAAELGVDISKDEIESGEAINSFENVLCIKAEGHVVFEDYQRLTRIAANYEAITGFINKSITSNIKDTPEYIEIYNQLEESRLEIKAMKNGSQKTQKKKQLEIVESQLEELTTTRKVGAVEPWIIDGLKTWVNVFLPDIFNVRLYPFSDMENFHIMSNVKREFFLEQDIESVHFLYGSVPTIKVSLLGVITAIPKKDSITFEPLKEFDTETIDEEGNEALSVENGFRGVFRGFDGLEAMVRTCRYPRIMVQPIAIYRSILPNPKFQRKA
ncbi:hypothetical protein PVK63_19770 [Aliivibrio sp. S2TY2]|uniref:DUF6414 family protein n=1 Tax=unclassified Aliivibrio TaxID=2645654 RepID=UPI002379D98B|nr:MULTISPECIES: hypothetical protein [unclassified Aliivibrio]MDD9177110.1 hypothetical protein [Aliivibrio sp. S3TY1]MDD9194185.1 hypothetical protein [Aliivibrio sp. S2TY2]